MPRKVQDVIAHTWESQANLSLFLALLVLLVFVLPSLGLEGHDERLYSNLATSVVLISGVAIAWRQRVVFLLASSIAVVTLSVRWAAWLSLRYQPSRLARSTDHCGDSDAFVHLVVAGLRPGADHGRAPPGGDSGLLTVWVCLGTRLRHRGLKSSRFFHTSRARPVFRQ